MKIRMLTGISGLDFNLVPKEETDRFGDGEAVRLMLSDQAEPADEESETALVTARVDVAQPAQVEQADDAAAEQVAAEAEARAKAEQEATDASAKAASEEAAAKEETEAKTKAEQELAEAAAKAEAEAKAAADATPAYATLGDARKAYRSVFNKGPGPSWSIEQIAAKIAEKQG